MTVYGEPLPPDQVVSTLRPYPIIIAIIDEDAMAKRLTDGRLGGACLDVFTTEPLPVDSPLHDLDNIVLTPHVGWTVDRVLHEFAEDTVAHVMAYLDGRLKREVLFAPTRRMSTVAARDRSQTEPISDQPTDSSAHSG